MTLAPRICQRPARFSWLDLASADNQKSAAFYRGMFGWRTESRSANGGLLHEFLAGGEAIASQYQLDRPQLAQGVPSHWTPYVGVADVDAMGSKAEALGGQILVDPFSVDGMARVSLIVDSVGALVGLWEIAK